MRKMLSLIVLGVIASPAAHANKVTEFHIEPQGPATRNVSSSDGERWDTIEPGTYEFRLKVDADCRYDKKPGFQAHGAHEIQFWTPVGGKSLVSPYLPQSGSGYWIETPIHQTFLFKMLQQAPQKPGQDNVYVKACNDELARRVLNNPDKTRYHFLAQGFTVQVPNAESVSSHFVCNPIGAGYADDHSKQKQVDVVVHCLPSKLAQAKIPKPKPEPKKAWVAPAVKSVQLKLDPTNYYGQCPVQIKVDAKITFNYPAEIKYQYLGDHGHQSPVFTLAKKQQAGTWNLAPWSRKIDIPNTTGQLGIGHDTNLYQHQGWMKVRLLSPVMQDAATVAYTVRCPRKPAKGPGGLQQAPAVPKPPATLRDAPSGPASGRKVPTPAVTAPRAE